MDPSMSSVREPPAARRHAPIRARMAAGLLDLVAVALVCAFLPQPFAPILPVLIFVTYHVLATWWLRASLGKALLGLRVIRLDGPVTLAWSLLRAGPGYLVLTVFGLGWAAAALPPDRRPLHDRVIGSDVIMVEAATLRPRQAAARLARWSNDRGSVTRRRQGGRAALAALWAWLAGIGTAVQRAIDWLRDDTTTGPSAATTLSSTAKTWVVATASVITAAVLGPVPPLQNATEWLVTPRTWVGAEPAPTPDEARLALQDWVADAVGDPDAEVPWCPALETVEDFEKIELWCVQRTNLARNLPFVALTEGDQGRALLDAAGFQDSGVACLSFEIVGEPGAWKAREGGPFCFD